MARENNIKSRRADKPNQTEHIFRRTIDRPIYRPRQSPSGPTRLASNNNLSVDGLARDHNTDRINSENKSVRSTIASSELSDMEPELAPAIPDSQGNIMIATSQARLSSPEARLAQSEADLLNQKRNNDLEHCISLDSSTHGIHGEEARLRQVISSLKDKLERERLLTKNYEELEADRLGFINTSLSVQYDNLHSNIRDTSSAICHLSRDDTLPEQRTGFSHLANNWAKRIGGCDLGSLLYHYEAAQIPKKVILVSLTAAGIFELALEKVFPEFLATDSPLLDQYRKQGGCKALRRLDSISIKSLLSDKDVKKAIISEKSNRDITQRSPHDEREAEAIGGMRSSLYHALTVKIELMLSVKRFKYLFFRPGTLFDAEKMEVVKSQAGDSALLSQEVKICLLPAFFTISEAGNENGVGEESSFRVNYSKALAEVIDEDIESLVLVEKAIVFL
ncbi:Uncharacterized protein HZ326_25021 [Fusarium oxysporum f. sp. albedinis]|nr:Uncharacterized protein HZ326_25021 [Fusarium oxysporum f. sp. albedinis]